MSERQSAQLNTADYHTLSFDCYGTLIDWENGILDYLRPILESYDVHVIDEWILEFFAEHEPALQAQGGRYRKILSRLLEQLGNRLAFAPNEAMLTGFASSIECWQPFPDTVPALSALRQNFTLVALSNIDDDLFAISAEKMQNPFTHIITAEQVGAYKPDKKMFKTLLKNEQGPILHVAQSRYHDILPATQMGLDTVWINRPSLGAAKPVGAAQPVEAEPTWQFESMAEFSAAWSS